MITFEDIMKLEQMQECKLLTGEKGLNHPIKWMHTIYETQMKSWIRADVLVCTSGLGFLEPEKDLLSVVKQISEVDAAGLIVETGMHINIISKKVIQYARELGVPLFAIQNTYKAHQLVQEISKMCIENEEQIHHSEAFKLAVYMPYSEETKKQLCELGYDEQEEYVSVCFAMDHTDASVTKWTKRRLPHIMFSMIREKFDIPKEKYLHYKAQDLGFALIPLRQKKISGEIYNKLNEVRSAIYQETRYSFSIGVGNKICTVQEFMSGIYQSRCAFDGIRLCEKENEVALYEKMGIYRIFFQMQNDKKLLEIYQSIVGILCEEGEENNVLLETLKAYVDCGCNLVETAKILFVHRNTLKYRLNKIRALLGVDIDDPNENFKILLAFKIQKYLQSKGMYKSGGKNVYIM